VDGSGGTAGAGLEQAARLVLGRALGDGVGRDELRRAFRRRALELHPDRAEALGRDPRELADAFRALSAAFALLAPRAGDDAGAPPAGVRPAPRPLPPRPLRFAEWLYYTGRITWADLAEAIAWQRREGRRIGRWFVERGLIDPDDVREVRAALARHNAAHRAA